MGAKTLSEFDEKLWHEEMRARLEEKYLAGETPWEQSGFRGSVKRWRRLRYPIVEAIEWDGRFLDIGCANGYLIQSLHEWLQPLQRKVQFFGIDVLEPLVELARARLPPIAAQLFVGNAFTWKPPVRFHFVRTELCYVPEKDQPEYLARLLDEVVAPNGRLLVCEYRSRGDDSAAPWVDEKLRAWRIPVAAHHSGFDSDGTELTRVAVCPAQ